MQANRPVRVLVAGALLVLLAACSQTGGGGGVLAGMSRATAPTTTRIANGRINVAGPQGFCVQKSTRINSGGGGFVALGQCASISGNPADATVANPALLSVTATPLSDNAQATPEALRRYFTEGDGRGGVKSARLEGGVLFIRASDRSARRPAGLSNSYWRALYQSNGYLISLSVSGLADSPISEATGRRLLGEFLQAMRAANPEGEKSANAVVSLFNRLL